jgi:HD-GYP domain-containing protein (c-di-GMP phosphodiesterase class II)
LAVETDLLEKQITGSIEIFISPVLSKENVLPEGEKFFPLADFEKQLGKGKSPSGFLILTQKDWERVRDNLNEHQVVAVLIYSLGKFESDDERIIAFRTNIVSPDEFRYLKNKAEKRIRDVLSTGPDMDLLIDTWSDQKALISIGKALSRQRVMDKLLRTILFLSKKITGADAGSIFLLKESEDRGMELEFTCAHTKSLDVSYEKFTMPCNTSSIAGYVACTGQILNIPDVYMLPGGLPYIFNRSYDEEHSYRTKSMLVVPMKGNDGSIIGVIQLLNCKVDMDVYKGNEAFSIVLRTLDDFKNLVVPFEPRYEELMQAIAGFAGIAVENNRMYLQIKHQFEEFVKASVKAIESRDPATSGHSFRVAAYCLRIAEAINKQKQGVYRDTLFSSIQLKELEFAALLHDFGKVYIDPGIFLKGKKLFPGDFRYLMLRLQFLYRSLELNRKVSNNREDKIPEKLASIAEIISTLTELNEPTVIREDPKGIIEEILSKQEWLTCADIEGLPIPLLTDNEIVNFSIRRGSLNPEERKVIESHVVHTWDFVSNIPWPEEYRRIPEFALKHHEKLDGSGYPQGVKGGDIPLQARMICVADIYDALSAPDRPYKKAVPHSKVLSILREEGESGKLDADLVELFISRKLWE